METSSLRKQSQKASKFLKFMANPLRLRLLCLLQEGPQTVTQLHTRLGISQPVASQHLALLRRHKVVGTSRQGQTVHYRVTHPLVLPMLQQLHQHFCTTAGKHVK